MWKGWVSGLCDGWGNWARTRFIGPPQCKDGVGGGGGGELLFVRGGTQAYQSIHCLGVTTEAI